MPLLATVLLACTSLLQAAEFDIHKYPADGTRLLWLPPESGFGPSQHAIASALSEQGFDIWLVDLFSSYFLPTVASSLERIPAADIAELIEQAQDQRPLLLLGSGRGTLPLLRGVHHWQRLHPNRPPPPVLLLSPQFYQRDPVPGRPARLMPVTGRTNLQLFILQPKKSPWFWKLTEVLPVLEGSGSEVYLQVLPDLRDRFHFRPDAARTEQAAANRLPVWLTRAARLMLKLPARARPVMAIEQPPPPTSPGKTERILSPWTANPQPPALRLPDLEGRLHTLNDYRGQVVLVNFWASWCPPCVHEMPSMQRLADTYSDDGFTVLAVNMAEEQATVRRFLNERVQVRFTILMDQNGRALKNWGVFAFPTSFLLDRQGRIRYALYGAIEWDREDVQQILQTLLRE